MNEYNIETPKTDHRDYGPMGSYDDDAKPVCIPCQSMVFVIATGRAGNWRWTCTKCQREYEPIVFQPPAPEEKGDGNG